MDFSSRAKWLAIFAGIGAGIFYVFIVLLMALFVDLLVSRGRTPNLAQLSVPEQEQFLEAWKSLPEETRIEAARHIGYGNFDSSSKSPVKAEDKQRFDTWVALAKIDKLPPLPGRLNPDELKKWSEERGAADGYVLAMKEHELRWRAYVWHFLKEHIGEDAANAYQPKVNAADQPPVPGLGEENRNPHGVLSLVVRLRGSLAGRLLNFVALLNPWMWEGSEGRDPNRHYLTGLLMLAIAAALLRAACMVTMNIQASKATVDAVMRLRRVPYLDAAVLAARGQALAVAAIRYGENAVFVARQAR